MLFDGIVTMLLSSVLENRSQLTFRKFQRSLGKEIMLRRWLVRRSYGWELKSNVYEQGPMLAVWKVL